METLESIRTFFQKGEWVTSMVFKEAYFHIPINPHSRKYLHFHVQSQSYKLEALLSSAPMEFTLVVKEVKLMSQNNGRRIHQYRDDWLVRATSHQTCLHDTQILVAICQELGWIVNMEKSELKPKQIFTFVGYQYDLRDGKIRHILECWQTFNLKIQKLLTDPYCWIRQLMSLLSQLTATKKPVHLVWLHLRLIKWHLKNHGGPQNHEKW